MSDLRSPARSRIDAEILRVGKAVTIARARLWSDGKIAATLTGIYGAARATALAIAPTVAAGVRPALDLPDRAGAEMGGPSFVRHFGYRWAEGARPFAGSNLRTSKIYVRHKDPAPLTESHVVALIDCIPSVILQLMSTAGAVEFAHVDTCNFCATITASRPRRGGASMRRSIPPASGYSCESCVLIDPGGAPAACRASNGGGVWIRRP